MQIRLEDLFKACPKCGGEGIVAENGEKPDLTQVDSSTGLAPCGICKGHGGEITPTGDAIRKFIKHLRRQGQL